MMPAIIRVREGVHLSAIQPTDKPALMEHLRGKDVYNSTLNIPHPYREADADWWIQRRVEQRETLGKEACFAIRDTDEKLIGVVSADSLEPDTTHRAEIGYWLASPYWGQGIMTDAVRAYIIYAFGELQLLRLTAHVFEFNVASARVLEKNGFKLEGRLRKHISKDGQLLNGRFYGLLKEEFV
jgi:[ribosomal protein S5]-alanine N-acetyltransferase